MSPIRSTSILFTILTIPLLLQAMPMSPPQALHRELPQASTDLKADVDAAICRINGVNIPDPALVLEQLERGNESALEAIGIDTRSRDLVASIHNLLQQCAIDPSEVVQPPLSSVATQLTAPVNNLVTGSMNDLIVGDPQRGGSTPQDDSADTDVVVSEDNSDDSDEPEDGRAETDNGTDSTEDESGEGNSDDTEPEADAQDDDAVQDASDSDESNDGSVEDQDTDETPEDSNPTVSADDQSPSVDNSAPADSSNAEETPSSTDEQTLGASGGEDCTFQDSSSSRFEAKICVDNQTEM